MKVPILHGYIDRRILVNFTADLKVVGTILPEPFKPKAYRGKAIIGICLIRLTHIKPKGFPDFLGISSENGAHRIAVEWDDKGHKKEGVYILRRDTSLRLNALAGGRLFPGKHHLAKFDVKESAASYHIAFISSDNTSIAIDAKRATAFDSNSIFESLENASMFFEQGELGYSPHRDRFEGLQLKVRKWQVQPLEVSNVRSSFYHNEVIFPKGSVQFDNALLMTKVEHEWHSKTNIGVTCKA